MKWNLKKRAGGGYAARFYIPARFRHLHPTKDGSLKSEIVRGLGTKDRAKAKRKAEELLPSIAQMIYRLPDPKDYSWEPQVVEVEGPYGEPFEFIEDEHPELTTVAEEIAEAHGVAEAKKWLAKARGEIVLSDLATAYGDFCETRGRPLPATVAKTCSHIEAFVEWWWHKDAKLEEITPPDADRFITKLVAVGKSGKTVNSYISSLSTAWRWAKRHQHVKWSRFSGQFGG